MGPIKRRKRRFVRNLKETGFKGIDEGHLFGDALDLILDFSSESPGIFSKGERENFAVRVHILRTSKKEASYNVTYVVP